MKCPFCSSDMEKGVIQSRTTINWSPQENVLSYSLLNKDTIAIKRRILIKGAAIPSMMCKSCHKIIIDY